MQTRKLFRGMVALLAGVATLGVAACDDTDVVETPQVTTLSVSPTGPISLTVGQSIQIVASAQNATGAVSFTSSNPAVATVNATTGAVTAVSAGTTSIIASVGGQGGGTVQQAVQVTVTAAGGGQQPQQPGDTAARIQIVSVVDENNLPVPLANATGDIFVRVDYTRGPATALEVRVNNTVACRQTFGTTAAAAAAEGADLAVAQVEFVCPINTARADTLTGAPTFPNGPATITAVLLRNTTVIASASTQQYTLANRTTLGVTFSTTKQATSPATGLLWRDGDLTVSATPAIFQAGTTTGRVVFTVRRDDGTILATRTDSVAPYSVTFPETLSQGDQGLRGVTDTIQVTVTGVTRAGGEFDESSTVSLRYDNVAPINTARLALPTTTEGGYLGANFAFSAATGTGAGDLRTNLLTGIADVQPGVGVRTGDVTFAVFENNDANRTLLNDRFGGGVEGFAPGSAGDTTNRAQAFASGRVVTNTSELQSTETNQAYLLVARIRDVLGNARYFALRDAGTGSLAPFGVDVTPPTVVEVDTIAPAISGTAINPTGFEVRGEDTGSGFSATPVWVSATRQDSAGTSCFIDGDSAGGCQPDARPSTLTIGGTDGYYTFTARVRDRAGNLSEPVTLVALRDSRGPVFGATTFSATVGTTSTATYGVRISDNVDLRDYTLNQLFPGFATLPLTPQTSIDNTFGAPLTTTTNASVSVPFIRGVQVNGVAYNTTQFIFVATDQARNVNSTSGNISGGGFQGLSSDINAFNLTAPAPGAVFCNGGADCGTNPTSRPVTATVTSNNRNAATPFTHVFFYVTYDNGATWQLIGVDTTASSSTGTNERTFNYSVSFSPTGIDQPSANLMAVGVEADGDAVRAGSNVTVSIVGTL